MPTYVPSDTPTETHTDGYVRQNCNKKNEDPLGTVRRSDVLHVPWGHTKADIEEYQRDPVAFFSSHGGRYAKACVDFPEGSLVLVPNGKKGLIVKFKSGVKLGVISSLCIAVYPRACGHVNVCGGRRCSICDESIQEVFSPLDTQKLCAYLKAGLILEPFWSIYREIEIVGEADYNGVDGRSMAGQDSVGTWPRYWKLRD
jgi:hypothetical protein